MRTQLGLFLVEGKKGIKELLASNFELELLFTISPDFNSPADKTFLITEAELKKISKLKTPQTAVAVFKIPPVKKFELKGLILALDGVRDPGNLGTIIRLCDWFGIENLLCSPDTVDCYNPKVVQASMGSITRVNIVYEDIESLLAFACKKLPLLGTFLEGENMYTTNMPEEGIMIMGNEANGISEVIERLVTQKINIPQFGPASRTESLNVATATAILLSEYRRQHNY